MLQQTCQHHEYTQSSYLDSTGKKRLTPATCLCCGQLLPQLDSSPTKEVPQWIIDNLKPHNMPTSSIVLSDSEKSIFSINNTTLDFHGKCSGISLYTRSKFYQQLPNGEWEEVEP